MRMVVLRTLCLLLGGSSLILTQSAAGTDLEGTVVRVLDGDSLLLRTNSGSEIEVRLANIDAPEHDQPYGKQARRALHERVRNRTVSLRVFGADQYQRILACPIIRSEDLCLTLVSIGAAWVYRTKRDDPVLSAAENRAQQAQLGLWAQTDKKPLPPWQWRKRPEPGTAPPNNCQIKGNISRQGQRIYHLPGQQHYQQTGISIARGERWFCSESQAQEAGWRKARG